MRASKTCTQAISGCRATSAPFRTENPSRLVFQACLAILWDYRMFVSPRLNAVRRRSVQYRCRGTFDARPKSAVSEGNGMELTIFHSAAEPRWRCMVKGLYQTD